MIGFWIFVGLAFILVGFAMMWAYGMCDYRPNLVLSGLTLAVGGIGILSLIARDESLQRRNVICLDNAGNEVVNVTAKGAVSFSGAHLTYHESGGERVDVVGFQCMVFDLPEEVDATP
jgi:hypothetical protein